MIYHRGASLSKQHTDLLKPQSILPHAGINEFRCYEAKTEESEKGPGSRRESNPGHLWLEPPVLCHWAMTAI